MTPDVFWSALSGIAYSILGAYMRNAGMFESADRGYAEDLTCLTCGQRDGHRTFGMLVPWWEVHPTHSESGIKWAFCAICCFCIATGRMTSLAGFMAGWAVTGFLLMWWKPERVERP